MTAEQLEARGLSLKAVRIAEEIATDRDCELATLWNDEFDEARSQMFSATMADFYEVGGGFGAVVSGLQGFGPGMQAPRIQEVETAAAILYIVRTITEQHAEINGPGSVNKAVFIIEETGKNYGFLHGRTKILGSWGKYKNVSHLAFAMRYCIHKFPIYDHSQRANVIAVLLAVARDYQRFATTYFPSRQTRGPLLQPAEMWTVPDDLLLPDASARAPLPDDMLDALREYRAPA
jgi:hypothetical protein